MTSASGKKARARQRWLDISVLPECSCPYLPGVDANRDGGRRAYEYVCIGREWAMSYSLAYVCRRLASRLFLRRHRVQHLGIPGLEEILERLPAHGGIDVQVGGADHGA